MKRFVLIVAAGLLASIGVTGAVAAASSGPRAALRDFVCQKSIGPAGRVISVTSVMRPLTGTQKLEMRFELLQKADGSSVWSPVSGPHFGVWVSPTNPPTLGQRPGDVWKVPFPVADLEAPFAYRLEVSFRWLGTHDRVIGTASRTTATCQQPELRPDLTVNSLKVDQSSLRPLYDNFLALIENTGATGVGSFTVQLTYTHDQASVTQVKTVARLGAHAARTLDFTGLRCDAGTQVTVTDDPQDLIDVYTRSNASLTVVCPSPATPAASRRRRSLS